MHNDWEHLYSADTFRDKNKYPSEDFISLMMRNYV